MKVLFAVSNESVSESIVKKYQQMYKEIISSKNVYYFNAILKEIQKDKTYDRIVISEDLEPFTNNNYETIDNFLFEKLDSISDEAVNISGDDIPIILIATDRRTKSDSILVKLFGIGVYSALLGQDRSIDEVCKLIQKPRSKKEAKLYYKIDAGDVEYRPENEGDVSETEIQNILTHYKRLGRNEDRYVESFDNIASQYTDQQLKVIIKFLPLNVKAVLEENSPRYQQLTSFSGKKSSKLNNYQSAYKTKKNNNTDRAISNSGIKVESIASGETKMTKPVIIPSANRVKKVIKQDNTENTQTIKNTIQKQQKRIPEETSIEPVIENFEDDTDIEPIIEKEPVKRRGRPRKIQPEIKNEVEETTKKRRGRPRKNPVQIDEEDILPGFNNLVDDDNEDILPGFEDIDENIEENEFPGFENIDDEYESNDGTLPGFDDEEDDYQEGNTLPGFDEEEDNQEENTLPGFDEEEDYQEDSTLPGFDNEEEDEYQDDSTLPGFDNQNDDYENSNLNQNYYSDYESNNNQLETLNKENPNLQNLLTQDKKIVAFLGTSKNGTSFLVNNIAEMLSRQGIKTAILDLTKNRNAYYIYTKNEEDLRKTAYECTEKLIQGVAQGIRVNNNLDVYTSLPGDANDIDEYGSILETLVRNYSLVLLDCDFSTPYGYLKEAQEIYLIQSMDVLTIQPLTVFLRELKAKGILEQNKLRAVINKFVRIKGVPERTIIGGMSFYNDPAMSFMTELFNRETIPYCTIPFDNQAYVRYLAGVADCEVSLKGYSKEIIAALGKLANMVYPLINNGQNYNNKAKYSNPKYNKYATTSDTFSRDMNSTLDKMKRNY